MKAHRTILLSCFIERSPQAMPLATSILKTSVSDLEGLEISLSDYTIQSNPEEAGKEILKQKPDSIGCSLYIWNVSFFRDLITYIKRISHDTIIYCGGPEATASPGLLLKTGLYDYIIPGEGEIPFRRLMLSLQGIEDKPDSPILPKAHLDSLSGISSPFLEGVLLPEKYDGVLWELSRGCPFNCAFCCESRGVRGVRYYDITRISAELDLFENSGVNQVFVLDPTFNIDKARALEILSLIKHKAPYIHFTIEIRAELLDEELAEAFSHIHCSLQIGLQSCHNNVLEYLNRNIDKEKFSEKIALLNKYGISFGLDLIIGLPGDSMAGFKESLDYAVGLIPNHLDIFRLSVFPGTELYDRAGEFNLNYSAEPPYNIISSPDFNPDELDELENYAHAVDQFYNKGKAAPWLLPLLDLLDMEASEFFELFMQFSQSTEREETDFENIAAFVHSLLKREDEDDSLAVVMDLILFNHLYSECLYSAPLEDFETSGFDRSIPYEKSDNLRTGIFSYDVTLYYELGMFDISAFIQHYPREVSYGFFFNLDGSVQIMSLSKELFMYLQAIDGKKTERDILSIIKCEADEIEEFTGFLMETSLIKPAR